MSQLLLARHGQSVWNKKNIFTGWVDVPLSKEGMDEAVKIGKTIAHYNIDAVYTSALIRAQMTAWIALLDHPSGSIPCLEPSVDDPHGLWYTKQESGETLLPTFSAWELNERMYGDLQGKNKQEMVQMYGKEQVHKWRRGFRDAPPGGESLLDTANRVLPYFQKTILPQIQQGKTVFLSAHGNSLRAIVMYLESLSEEKVPSLEISTGEVLVYSYHKGAFVRI